jgi:SAM-dependent methyltransferase
MSAKPFATTEIKEYYDRHTPSFVRHGQGGGSLHRAAWGPGVSTREQAFHYVDDLVAAVIRQTLPSSSTPHVVDLGCGVGESLCYLASRVPIRGTGITLSPIQVAMATARVTAASLSTRVSCVEGDYCDLPAALEPADVVYAIESFVHGPSPDRFFEQCARVIKPGGRLVICDDVLRPAESPEAARTVDTFKEGWHVNSLLGRHELRALAAARGFEHESTADLTPFLELGRWRDRAGALALAALRRLGLARRRWDYLAGGHALQTCLARGWIGYELSVFRFQSRMRNVATTGRWSDASSSPGAEVSTTSTESTTSGAAGSKKT